jgi:hypothetical protein
MAAGFEPATAASFGQSGSIQTRAGFDVIGLLPVHAGERLRQLRQKSRDAHSLLPEFADRLAANTAPGDAERWVQRLLAPRSENGFNMREDDPQVVQPRQELEKLADEARRLAELDQVRSEAWQSASRVVQAVEQWREMADPATPCWRTSAARSRSCSRMKTFFPVWTGCANAVER